MDLLKSLVNENHAPQLLDLTMQEIIRAGKCTNPYHHFALGRLATFFKDGVKSAELHLENPVNFESGETSASLKNHILSLSSDEHVALATYLLACCKAGECLLADKSLETADWINFVLQRQR